MSTAITWTVHKIAAELMKVCPPWEDFGDVERDVIEAALNWQVEHPEYFGKLECELSRREMRRIYYGVKAEYSEQKSREWLAAKR